MTIGAGERGHLRDIAHIAIDYFANSKGASDRSDDGANQALDSARPFVGELFKLGIGLARALRNRRKALLGPLRVDTDANKQAVNYSGHQESSF